MRPTLDMQSLPSPTSEQKAVRNPFATILTRMKNIKRLVTSNMEKGTSEKADIALIYIWE